MSQETTSRVTGNRRVSGEIEIKRVLIRCIYERDSLSQMKGEGMMLTYCWRSDSGKGRRSRERHKKTTGKPRIYQFKLEHFTIPVLGNREPGNGLFADVRASAPHPGARSALHPETGSEAPGIATALWY